MLSSLKKHPFAVEAFFRSSIVLTFAFPKEVLQPLIPECLQLDVHDDKWAFVAMALVDTKDLRPKGLPVILGQQFTLVGYRIFVRYNSNAGKRLRGLYILRSETDSRQMQVLGNIFTNYDYKTIDIQRSIDENKMELNSTLSPFNITIDTSSVPSLPATSPFVDWKEARRYAGPLPFTFSYDKTLRTVLIVEGVRTHWTPQSIEIAAYDVPYIKEIGNGAGILASAFMVNNIPYYWKKGKEEIWRP